MTESIDIADLHSVQCFTFKAEHQSGISNQADVLSRPKISQEKCEISNFTEKYMIYPLFKFSAFCHDLGRNKLTMSQQGHIYSET